MGEEDRCNITSKVENQNADKHNAVVFASPDNSINGYMSRLRIRIIGICGDRFVARAEGTVVWLFKTSVTFAGLTVNMDKVLNSSFPQAGTSF